MTTEIRYIVVPPECITIRYGHVAMLALWQDNDMTQLDQIFNDCIIVYPRPGQPVDPNKVVLAVRFGTKKQAYLRDQTGSEAPLDEIYPASMDVGNKLFKTLQKVKQAYPDLDETILIEYQDENGETQTKQIPTIWEEHVWAGDI